MKAHNHHPAKRGFTLLELIVAMAITSIIVSILVSVTSVALDTFDRSRSELRAARQARSMIDSMARDLEALVVRTGDPNQWLSATTDSAVIGNNLPSTSAAKLIFFTAATDRYNGNIGSADDRGGDVSCVAYELRFDDPIERGADYETFVLNRLLVDPDKAFVRLLGLTDPTGPSPRTLLDVFTAYNGTLSAAEDLDAGKNFIAENIYQFTIIFNVELTNTSGAIESVPISVGLPNADGLTSDNFVEEFKLYGNKLVVSSAVNGYSISDLESGKVTSITIAVTALSDFGVAQSRGRSNLGNNQAKRAEFLDKNSYQYSKTVQIPSR